MKDQKVMWNDIHHDGMLDDLRFTPSDFVKSIAPLIPVSSKVLELGCGSGGDARFLKSLRHEVCATDFSDIAIEKNKADSEGVNFLTVDMSKKLPFDDGSFDVVYANLSLHYFDDQTTASLFNEINRVISSGGKLIYRCKSIYSQKEKVGAQEIAPNVFMQDGHLRHLFSIEYSASLLDGAGFDALRNEYTEGMAYGKYSYFVEAVAVKRA